MARKIKGAIVEHVGRDGLTYRYLRFTANGKRQHVPVGAVSEAEAQRELRHQLADLERGIWQPAKQAKAAELQMPTFHEFAAQWWTRHKLQLASSTQVDYEWRLRHLLRFFADYPLNEISYDLVEQYIEAKLGESEPLSARSVNMTLTLMGAILEGAVERELIVRNPAKGKARRVRERAPRRTHPDRSEQIAALLAATSELDAEARADRQHVSRRATVTTLMFAGLRIGALCALRWRDVDLATGWLTVGESKTDAGRRKVKLRGALRDELANVRASTLSDMDKRKPGSLKHEQLRKRLEPAAFVFATRTGARPRVENVRNRVLAPAVKRASAQLAKDGLSPLPDGLTPHSMRRTFASVLYALGEDPGIVCDEMGHTDPGLALSVYRQTMRRGEDEKAALRALVEGEMADTADEAAEEPLLGGSRTASIA